MTRAVVQTRMELAQVGQNDPCGRSFTARLIPGQKCPWNRHLHDRTAQNRVLGG
jgi:hypothetical protein